jgi:hypothetical protein
MATESSRTNRPFLLMEGGPLFSLEQRIGSVRKKAPLTKRRALYSILITWVPLFVLSLIQGTAIGRSLPVPFLRDFSAYTRFLIAVPLFLLAENILGPRIADTSEHFVTSNIILAPDYDLFDEAVARGLRRRDSKTAEIVIAIIAIALSIGGFTATAVHATTWYAMQSSTGRSLTWAGWWFICIALPMYHFLAIRWLWRLFLWFQFLAAMNKLNLQLFPTHPDQAGGIGFVGEAQRFFGILIFASSCATAGIIANEIVYNKISLQSFAPAILGYVLILLAVLVLPLLIFAGRLLGAKRRGLFQYGALGTAYTGSFHKKWILNQDSERQALLGSADIQSLADLGNSYALIERMKPLPVDPRTLIHLAVAALLPMAPLLLTVMPLKQVISLVVKLLA